MSLWLKYLIQGTSIDYISMHDPKWKYATVTNVQSLILMQASNSRLPNACSPPELKYNAVA